MNNDLISRSALLKEGIRGKYLVGADGSIFIPVHCVRKYIKEAPAVDAVIPVRCAQCKHSGLQSLDERCSRMHRLCWTM